ncbi:MAG: Fic family protein [Dehalococcoidia bacterium]|jgi:Fic family protein
MRVEDFAGSPTGDVRRQPTGYSAFIPRTLPRSLSLAEETVNSLSEADRALGTLNGMGETLPNPHLLIVPFTRREAVLSSKIEGTQASLSELFQFEAGNETAGSPDVREVSNYVRAMEYGLQRLKELPISTRLVREVHEQLLWGVRGEHYTPGEFRTSQNWIGAPGCKLDEATFVPPPPSEMIPLLSDWEQFLNAGSRFPPLVECALMHYQFEVIHPFLDGNGRVGRLLVTLYLVARQHLCQPLLYLSAFFESHRDEYYEGLLSVSQRGDWGGWLRFFLRGVAEQSWDAVRRSRSILGLQDKYRRQLYDARASRSSIRLVDILFQSPVLTVPRAMSALGITYPSAAKALLNLAEAGVVEEISAGKRGRTFCARELVRKIEEGLGAD